MRADNDTASNEQRVKSMYLLGTLNVLPFEKQISVYSKVQKPSALVSVLSVQILAQVRN